ncbi:putative toxin-antitoxin system toxin component, PIN family [bacterium]|nr:putative toxin-antitoxin system toxin component, PIN family [bacterium]
MKFYAVIDTNVLVSAVIKPDSVPGIILKLVFYGELRPVFDSKILGEYEMVLLRPKFGLAESEVDDIIGALEAAGDNIRSRKLDVQFTDIEDKKFYEVFSEKRRDNETYLITGNIKHFPEDEHIVTPRQMLDIMI